MGISLKDKGDLDASIESYKQAIKIKPDYAEAHLNFSFALLAKKSVTEGLNEYEWRFRTAKLKQSNRHFSLPMWDGIETLGGKRILVWSEQGPGDVVMWSSCLTQLASQAEHCILECPKKLVSLFARSFPNIEVKVENRALDSQRVDFEVHLPIGSLFRHFIPEIGRSLKTDQFLVPDPARVAFWKNRLNLLGEGPFIGISWKSPVITPARRPNYTEISDWAPLFGVPNLTFINLQSTNFSDDLMLAHSQFGITVHHFDDLDHYDDLDEVAALSAALDLAISVSTAVSTISAGVGTPTKLLHWRQSSWNNILFTPPGPFVDVYERDTCESWGGVFEVLVNDIKKLNFKH
jgi:hypothetical protein